MSTILFLGIRVIHVLLAAVWIGATVFMTFLLMPAINDAGPAGGQIMMGLHRRKIAAYFGSLAGMTTLTGIYLYWRFTGGFDPVVSASRAGMAFGIGGVCGLAATIIGGAVVGRSSNKVVELMTRAVSMPDGAEKSALLGEVGVLKQRMSTFGMGVLLLQLVAASLMAVGHYI